MEKIDNIEKLEKWIETNTKPLAAIKMKCLDCCCYNSNEVRLCEVKSCPLLPFRLGKNPFAKRELSEEQRNALIERMNRFRAKNSK